MAKAAVADKDKKARRGPIAFLVLFVRQVVTELKKVVRPTRQELTTYSTVVVVFVLIIMAFIFGIDWLTGKGVMALFG
ncbi:MAG: preprotein translocase subunit SecE [Bifidobacteriaceae bacterium]|jgi:preprotein translocase subunit SecE|nr:preprotein translocase subunit SecE [Bifidobacteriaceae bacterium]